MEGLCTLHRPVSLGMSGPGDADSSRQLCSKPFNESEAVGSRSCVEVSATSLGAILSAWSLTRCYAFLQRLPTRPRAAERSGQGYGDEPSESEAGPQAVQAAEQARQVCEKYPVCRVTSLLSQKLCMAMLRAHLLLRMHC